MILRTLYGDFEINNDHIIRAYRENDRPIVEIDDNAGLRYAIQVFESTFVGVLEMLDDWNNPNKF